MIAKQVDNLFLEKIIGKGSFGEVYLTKIKGDNKLYATKIYNRQKIENSPEMKKYLKSEVIILRKLNHPNIVKLKEVKKTKKHFYIVTEYYNGDNLLKTLEKYKMIYGKPFSEEIVQHLMKQIINAFNYIHSKEIMHRDIKLENILLNYEAQEDKNNMNILKSTPIIIDFGLAIILKNSLTESVIGNPLNMSPLLLKKLTSHGKIRKLGYDKKEDIWSIGSICYEMLIGNPAFDADDIDDLVIKVENGNYNVPISLSEEVVSFLNAMLQYEPKNRLSCEQLIKHKFLTENIHNFHKIELNQVLDKIKKNKLEINIKKNETILNVLNHDNENKNKLININNNFTSFPLKIKENENITQELDLNEQKKENTNIYYNKINNNQYNGQIFEYYNINQDYTDINCTKGTNHFFDNINFI